MEAVDLCDGDDADDICVAVRGRCACSRQARSYRCMRDCKFPGSCASSRLAFVDLRLDSFDVACVFKIATMYGKMRVGVACSATQPFVVDIWQGGQIKCYAGFVLEILKN